MSALDRHAKQEAQHAGAGWTAYEAGLRSKQEIAVKKPSNRLRQINYSELWKEMASGDSGANRCPKPMMPLPLMG